MSAPIIYVGGSKGGVGKSKLSFSVVHYLGSQGKKILLLETDTSNPDVYKAHCQHENSEFICKLANLDSPDGWIELVNLADANPEHIVVINSAARSNTGIEKYGTTLKETLQELKRELITFWMINRQRDSIELLRSFLNTFPDAVIHVCRNLYFGESEKFQLYNDSKTRKIIEKSGMTLDFPDLADRVADQIYSGRLPLNVALSEFPIGDRAELKRWISECEKMFAKVFN